MAEWVALLRGVNVNGITIKSAELREVFVDLGFAEVRTVLASGNVVFNADAGGAAGVGDAAALKSRIEAALRDRFHYDAWVVLLPRAELARIVDAYPFESSPELHEYVVFSSATEALDELLADFVPDTSVERVARGEGVIYWACPKGSSTDTPFAKRAGAARFKRTTTTRNRNTLRKLV